MHSLGTFFVYAICAMFFVGLAGSAVVVLIAFFEDLKELFGSDESVPAEPARHQAGQNAGANSLK
jgi:hypothetical protein